MKSQHNITTNKATTFTHWGVQLTILAALLILPTEAWAHTEEAEAGFSSGLMHPLSGLDHMLAMVSVGIISSQLGGINIWRVPAVFVLSMIGGGILGAYHVPFALSEVGIALSVLLLGIGMIFSKKATTPLVPILVTACVMFFGICHGYAHGEEMPRAAEPAYYTLGFISSTSTLHVVGVVIGEFSHKQERIAKSLRYIGAITAAIGIYFLVQTGSAA